MRERERVKFQKEIWSAVEAMLIRTEPDGHYQWWRRGERPLEEFKITKKDDPKGWIAGDETAPKGWALTLTVGGFRKLDDKTRFEFNIHVRSYYTKYGRAGAGFYTLKHFPVLADGSDLKDRIAELRAFIQRRRRRVRHTVKKKRGDDGS